MWLKEHKDDIVIDRDTNYARLFSSGIEYGNQWSEFSRTTQYVAIEVPGHYYWTGRMSPRAYVRRKVVVVAKSKAVKGWTDCGPRDRLEFEDISNKRLRDRVHTAMLRLENGESMERLREQEEAQSHANR